MPVEFFGTDSAFGEITGWEPQNGPNPANAKSYSNALGQDGDEIRNAEYDAKTTYTNTYVSTLTTGNLTIPAVGDIIDGVHIDSVQVTYNQTGFPTMTVTGHKHTQGNLDANTRKYRPSVTLPAVALGVPSEIEDAFELSASADCGMRSLTYTLSATHVDELNGTGGHLAGENHDGVETIAGELTGSAIIGTDLSFDSAWFNDTNGKQQSNTGATTTSFNITKHIAKSAT
ncbi:MAG: hypothetical protein ACI4Q3_00600 [Kiritimatiellia bacterium]